MNVLDIRLIKKKEAKSCAQPGTVWPFTPSKGGAKLCACVEMEM